MYMFGVAGETHAHDYFEVISFYKTNLILGSSSPLKVSIVSLWRTAINTCIEERMQQQQK